MLADIVASGAIIALTAAWLVYDRRRQGDEQRAVVLAGVGTLAVLVDSLGPFGGSRESLPTSVLLVVAVVAFALAGCYAARRFRRMLGAETPKDS